MKKKQFGVSMMMAALASTGAAQQHAQGISELPADVVMRAWTDPAFDTRLRSAPGTAMSELAGAKVHFDNEGTIHFVVSTNASNGGLKVYGDTARLLSTMNHVGYREFDESTRQYLEALAYSEHEQASPSLKNTPSIIPLGSSGINVVIHDAGQSRHYSVPLNPIDIEHAKAIELQAIKVASSTTCCASGTCDATGHPLCSIWG